ncbi:MAG: hypothetical protein SFX73_19045 [Kofleriaceae bacterium]|nr:hypothetical protein [Kofleriaceae bacterium]
MRATALVVLPVLAGIAHADDRSFTRVWEYSTVPEGRTTIDLWHTQSARTFEGTLEIEHGITDSLDVALFSTVVDLGTGLHMQQTRAMGRYRLGERAEWPIDTLVQLSAAKDFDESLYRVEGLLVGARDFDRFLAAANAAIEVNFGNDREPDVIYAAAAGLTYQVYVTLKLGAETWGRLEDDTELLSAGPVANWYPTSNFWLTVGAGFGITEASDNYIYRAILGIEL